MQRKSDAEIELAAANTITRVFRVYRKRKLTSHPVSLTYAKYCAEQMVLNPHSLARADYLFTNVKQDNFFTAAETGSASLVRTLARGNVALLNHYVKNGIDIQQLAFHGFFYGQKTGTTVSLSLLETLSHLSNGIKEIVRDPKPINQVECYAIFDKQGNPSKHFDEILRPYLTNTFFFTSAQEEKLTEALKTIPLEEQFFAVLNYHEDLMLSAIKVCLVRAINNLRKNGEYADLTSIYQAWPLFANQSPPVKAVLRPIELILSFKKINNSFSAELGEGVTIASLTGCLKMILAELIRIKPQLAKVTIDSNFHLQQLTAGILYVRPISSPISKGAAQVFVPSNILDLCQNIVYGVSNAIKRYIGFGLFSEQEVMQISLQGGRLINAQASGIESLTKAHGSLTGPWALCEHDYGHQREMSSANAPTRMSFAALAHQLYEETQCVEFSLFSRLYEATICRDFYLHAGVNSKRYFIDYNIQKIVKGFEMLMSDYKASEYHQYYQYHLLLLYFIKQTPGWMQRTFSHCIDLHDPDAALQKLLTLLANIAAPKFDKLACTPAIFMEQHYSAEASPTWNVFNFVLHANVKQAGLYAYAAEQLSTLTFALLKKHPEVALFQWTGARVKGVALSDGEREILICEITNERIEEVMQIIHSAAQKKGIDLASLFPARAGTSVKNAHGPRLFDGAEERVSKRTRSAQRVRKHGRNGS